MSEQRKEAWAELVEASSAAVKFDFSKEAGARLSNAAKAWAQAENDADHARSLMAENERLRTRVAELESRTRPIPGVTDGSREYEAYTLDEVALIEAQRGRSYSRLRVTVRTMLALAANHAMLLGGDTEDYVALPETSGIAVLEFRDQRTVAEAERDEWSTVRARRRD